MGRQAPEIPPQVSQDPRKFLLEEGLEAGGDAIRFPPTEPGGPTRDCYTTGDEAAVINARRLAAR